MGATLRDRKGKVRELERVSARINASIVAERNTQGYAGEVWLIAPARGQCNDYAVTKQHALAKLGWPSAALLLAEVVVPSGEHHIVLVVRVGASEFVLDNLRDTIVPRSHLSYRWVRIQSPEHPKIWRKAAPARSRAGAFSFQSSWHGPLKSRSV